ncbi:MAG TPA: alpha/beta hydrolase, partial [Myxococcota bacterium]|nr:alpha/beta hydrolase [Myxococcota bacterium]
LARPRARPEEQRGAIEAGHEEDLRELVVEVSSEGAVLCGESFGGALSLSFALAHPGLVRGLVIVNSFPFVRERWKLALAPPALRLLPWGAMPVVRRFTESRLHSPHALPEDLAEFHERSRQIGRRGYIRRIEILRGYDVRERLHEIEPPALFLAGDVDRLVPSVEWARFMAARVPNATLRILEGYGHICLINHDLDLLEHVGPWWDEVGGGAAHREGEPARP